MFWMSLSIHNLWSNSLCSQHQILQPHEISLFAYYDYIQISNNKKKPQAHFIGIQLCVFSLSYSCLLFFICFSHHRPSDSTGVGARSMLTWLRNHISTPLWKSFKKNDSLNSMVPRGLKHIHSRELEFIPNWLATSWFVRNFSYGRNRLDPIIPVDCPCGVWWIYCAGEWARDMISHIETKMLCMINGCLSWSNKVNIDGLSVGECLCVYRCCHLL